MYIGAYLHLIGGKQYNWYYHYYSAILHYFGVNSTSVFNQIQKLTGINTKWYNKKITVKLSISNGKITNITIRNYPSGLF